MEAAQLDVVATDDAFPDVLGKVYARIVSTSSASLNGLGDVEVLVENVELLLGQSALATVTVLVDHGINDFLGKGLHRRHLSVVVP